MLASFKGTIIAGAIYFHFGEKAVYKYGASDVKYQQLRPNNLVMWEAIRLYCQNGYKSFCFGRKLYRKMRGLDGSRLDGAQKNK